MLKNLLLYRYFLFNTSMGTLLGYLGYKGYVTEAYEGDPTKLSVLITILFLVLLGSTGNRAYKISMALNRLKEGVAPEIGTGKKRLAKIIHIHDGAQWLPYLGLIGTVIGFIMALGSVDLNALSNADGVKNMIPQLMGGMKVALYTTMTGAFFGIWTEINYRMLYTATVCLIEDENKRSRHYE